MCGDFAAEREIGAADAVLKYQVTRHKATFIWSELDFV